ncbi:uncharacterized protein ACA1_052630 [Acanthamoeba castellanii str. Neff]|uniref:Protein CMSS1 n=1 Tax=Acanthamoeba castellanii (strain ATCC 30010 / Neff) TaxID=1257118 RepID=L8H5T1_ACACF|nr:uncharacterized protein ACA1_052630 [Acanthamoeba castellanii str. Neff]ELR20572.1 hypothetical protein ACA1_052630 [Acanthamoeba castellanii str. Neff]
MEVDRTLQVVKGGGHKKRPRSELQAVDAGAAPATTNAQQNKKDKGNKRRKTGGKKGSSKKADAKQDKLKVGGGLELLDAELLGAEEQATFFQAQYRTADPTLIISAGQALPLAGHFAVSSIQSGGKRDVNTELKPWLQDICGDQWQQLLAGPPAAAAKAKPDGGKPGGRRRGRKPKSQQVAANEAEDKGAPSVIIITSSGQRACDVFKALAEFHKSVKVMKLFSKIKLAEQVEMLNSSPVRIAVGTPHRLAELCRNGALKLHRLQFVVVDMWKNVKGISLLIQTDLYKLYFEFFNERVQKEETRLALF